jgi:transcriptional regulator with XRE-family HTH domain
MSRKKYNPRNTPSYKGSQSPFAKRLTKLIDEHGLKQREVAEAIEVQRQTVSLYTKGQALPDISTLTKIMKLFNASADYLLGITKAPTVDTKKRAVCDYVGLTEPAVDFLHEMKADKEKYSLSELFSNIIVDDNFERFIGRVQQFVTEDAEQRIFPYTDAGIMEFSADSCDTITEGEAEDYATHIGKRLISPEDMAHFYRKLSLELLERILLDISDNYVCEYVKSIGLTVDINEKMEE